jgi:hypothetical protein
LLCRCILYVAGNDGTPINITSFFYLPSVSRDLTDTQVMDLLSD